MLYTHERVNTDAIVVLTHKLIPFFGFPYKHANTYTYTVKQQCSHTVFFLLFIQTDSIDWS